MPNYLTCNLQRLKCINEFEKKFPNLILWLSTIKSWRTYVHGGSQKKIPKAKIYFLALPVDYWGGTKGLKLGLNLFSIPTWTLVKDFEKIELGSLKSLHLLQKIWTCLYLAPAQCQRKVKFSKYDSKPRKLIVFLFHFQLLNAVGNVRKTLTLPGDLNGLHINGKILLNSFQFTNVFALRVFAEKLISRLIEKSPLEASWNSFVIKIVAFRFDCF